ncbi:MAG: beta-lactamase family protein [Phycisphaeraceae bacterium]|nr:beta-lactamase family protein [Phycisphaeraceae bacterium]
MTRPNSTLCLVAALAGSALAQPTRWAELDSDRDGLPDSRDGCPWITYEPGFDWADCAAMDLNPDNDASAACKARERIANYLVHDDAFMTHIAFSIVVNGELHFADSFTYLGGGQFVRDPDGINRLYRIGSTTKPIVALTAMILQEEGVLSLDDWVNDDDGSQILQGGERRLRHLLAHQGAFKVDNGAAHLFCYPGDLAAFWADPNDLISPHYDSAVYGNLGGGYNYSAFNYSLAGAYLANRTGELFEQVVQSRVFDAAGMCTASFDGARAVSTYRGREPGVSQAASMHIGPYINLIAPEDEKCDDNFYSSEDVYGDNYTWQYYHLDETDGEARDPAGGVIASVIDMAHFAEALLACYNRVDGLVSQQHIRELWEPTHDFGCAGNCPYERYYAMGMFVDTQAGLPIHQVQHGGSRAGFASAFVLRPEDNSAVCILTNADASTVEIAALARQILDDFEN